MKGKCFRLFDHRAANVVLNTENLQRQGQTEEVTDEEHKMPTFSPMPRYWVARNFVCEAIPSTCYSDWLFGFKNVTSPTNERTFIGAGSTVCSTAGHSVPFIFFKKTMRSEMRVLLVANMSTRVFDYIVRQKVGGVNLSFFIVNQLPVIPPGQYDAEVADIIWRLMLELSYTSYDMLPFANSLGRDAPPFEWSVERRMRSHCEARSDLCAAI